MFGGNFQDLENHEIHWNLIEINNSVRNSQWVYPNFALESFEDGTFPPSPCNFYVIIRQSATNASNPQNARKLSELNSFNFWQFGYRKDAQFHTKSAHMPWEYDIQYVLCSSELNKSISRYHSISNLSHIFSLVTLWFIQRLLISSVKEEWTFVTESKAR